MTLTSPRPMADFSVTANRDGDACRLVVRGDLERTTVRTLIDRLLAAEQANVRSITIDLAGCDFIDRVGACVLVDAARRARRRGWHFSVANPSASGTQLFGGLALHRTIQVDR